MTLGEPPAAGSARTPRARPRSGRMRPPRRSGRPPSRSRARPAAMPISATMKGRGRSRVPGPLGRGGRARRRVPAETRAGPGPRAEMGVAQAERIDRHRRLRVAIAGVQTEGSADPHEDRGGSTAGHGSGCRVRIGRPHRSRRCRSGDRRCGREAFHGSPGTGRRGCRTRFGFWGSRWTSYRTASRPSCRSLRRRAHGPGRAARPRRGPARPGAARPLRPAPPGRRSAPPVRRSMRPSRTPPRGSSRCRPVRAWRDRP